MNVNEPIVQQYMSRLRWIYGALALTTCIAVVSAFEAGGAAYLSYQAIQFFKSSGKDTLSFQVAFDRQIRWCIDALVVVFCQGVIFFFVRRLLRNWHGNAPGQGMESGKS